LDQILKIELETWKWSRTRTFRNLILFKKTRWDYTWIMFIWFLKVISNGSMDW